MKLLNVQNQNFKGHGAGRIKALYMQNAYYPAQIPVFDELKSIGKAHNFDVFIHNNNILYSTSTNLPTSESCDYQLWSQDNKTILRREDGLTVVSGLYMPYCEQSAAKTFAQIKNAKHISTEAFLEGGNFFIGKKPDGKKYLILGYKDVYYSAVHYYLKDKLGEVEKDEMESFVDNLQIKNEYGDVVATYQEFEETFEKWGKIALRTIVDVFGVEKENLTLLSQGQYHNDLAIRPLNYPYVLVNDDKICLQNLKKLKSKFRLSFGVGAFVRELKKKLSEQKNEYCSCDMLCEELENDGYIPIRVGGGYGVNTINFINSIVHQNGDDLIYITNSAQSGNKYFEYLQTLFEKELKEKCPQISKTYFVKGAITDKKSNIVLEYLKRYKGGIHCLCAEEMAE